MPLKEDKEYAEGKMKEAEGKLQQAGAKFKKEIKETVGEAEKRK